MAFDNILFSPAIADEQERKGIFDRKERAAQKAFFDMGKNSNSAPYSGGGAAAPNIAPQRQESGMAGLFSNPEPNLMNFNGDQGSPQQYQQMQQPKKKGNFGEGLMKVLPLILGAITGGLAMGPMGIPMGLMYGLAGQKKGQLADRELDINDQYKQGSLNNQNADNLEAQSWHDEQLKMDDRKLAETIANNKESNRIADLRAKKTDPLNDLMTEMLKEKIAKAQAAQGSSQDIPKGIVQRGNENAYVPGPNDRVINLTR